PCARGEAFKVQVPKDRLWVMGDHRSASADSRAHQDDPNDGTVPVDRVIGRAFVVVWPVSHWQNLPIPETFEQPALAIPAAAAAVAAVARASAASAPLPRGFAGALPLVALGRRAGRRHVRRARRGGG